MYLNLRPQQEDIQRHTKNHQSCPRGISLSRLQNALLNRPQKAPLSLPLSLPPSIRRTHHIRQTAATLTLLFPISTQTVKGTITQQRRCL